MKRGVYAKRHENGRKRMGQRQQPSLTLLTFRTTSSKGSMMGDPSAANVKWEGEGGWHRACCVFTSAGHSHDLACLRILNPMVSVEFWEHCQDGKYIGGGNERVHMTLRDSDARTGSGCKV